MVKTKRKNIRKVLSCLMAFMMIFAFYPMSAHAADTLWGTIDIPSHVSTTGTATLDKSSKEGTYSGVWKANIPFAQLLKPHESKMQMGFPWAKNGGKANGEYAYVDYTVAFPENVEGLNIGESSVSTNTAILDKNPKVTVEGNKVHFILTTSGLDFPGIRDKVNEEVQDIANHMVKIEIPYAVKTKDVERAKEFDKKKIVGTGDFTTEQGRFLLTQFKFDLGTSNQPFTTKFAEVFAEKQVLPIKATLPGDLLLNGNTESEKVVEVTPENKLTFTGALDISYIKKQMKEIEEKYGKTAPDFEKIKLTDPQSTFTAKLTLPKGLEVTKETINNVALEGANGVFNISKATASHDGTFTVEMKLQNADKIKTYKDLKEAVAKCDDKLKVNVPGIQLENSVTNDQELTVKGELTGTMKAIAEFGSQVINFNFEWNAEQKAGGKDVNATDDKAIQLTLKVKKPEEIKADSTLDGDILIGTETEHTAVFETKPGNIHDFTGTLDVSKIKAAMKNYKTTMAANETSSNIKLEKVKSKFTATFTLPDGLDYTLPKTKDNVELLGASNTFTITNVVDNDKSINVEMTLKDGIDDFEKLEKAVNNCDDKLKVIVKGIKVSENATNDQKLKVTGSIEGNLTAKATLNNNIKNFNLNWTAEQSADGRDFTEPVGSKAITFTLNVNKPDTYKIENIGLEGDILINGDTEHEKVYETEPGDKLNYAGALNIKPIKEHMDQIETLFNNPDVNKIMLEGTTSEFTATFTLPEFVDYKDGITKDDIKFEGATGVFSITDLKVEGKVATIKMTLKDGITKYTDLKTAVQSCEDELKVTVPTVVSKELKEEKNLTAVGKLTGGMKSKATYGAKEKNFDLSWVAVQSAEGKDAEANDDKTIQGTIHVNQPKEINADGELEGDILIGNETEHDELFQTKPGEKHDFTGALNVKPIKDQMIAIEKQHDVDLDKILLNDTKSEFTAKFTLPEKLSFGKELTKENVKLEGADNVFSVSDVKVEGKTVTVKLTLRNNIHKYTELAKAIKDDTKDELKLIIPGVMVSDKVENDEIMTVVGEISGMMSATAIMDNSPNYSPKYKFNFIWTAKQSAKGKDKIAQDYKTIQFSLKAKVDKPEPKPNPDKPDSKKPENKKPGQKKPDNNKNPNTGDANSLEVYLMILSMALVASGLVAARKKEDNE